MPRTLSVATALPPHVRYEQASDPRLKACGEGFCRMNSTLCALWRGRSAGADLGATRGLQLTRASRALTSEGSETRASTM